jgi:hypothetical protein
LPRPKTRLCKLRNPKTLPAHRSPLDIWGQRSNSNFIKKVDLQLSFQEVFTIVFLKFGVRGQIPIFFSNPKLRIRAKARPATAGKNPPSQPPCPSSFPHSWECRNVLATCSCKDPSRIQL